MIDRTGYEEKVVKSVNTRDFEVFFVKLTILRLEKKRWPPEVGGQSGDLETKTRNRMPTKKKQGCTHTHTRLKRIKKRRKHEIELFVLQSQMQNANSPANKITMQEIETQLPAWLIESGRNGQTNRTAFLFYCINEKQNLETYRK